MGSFKLRLVLYFVLLSLVPLAGATWAFTAAAGRSEEQRADTSLTKSVRAAFGNARVRLDEAGREAATLARSTEVQTALVTRDRAALQVVVADLPEASFYAGDRLLAGSPPALGSSRAAAVVEGSEQVGRVVVSVPFDAAFVRSLGETAGLESDEQLLLVVDGRVAQGRLAGLALPGPFATPQDVRLGGTTYRLAGAALPANSHRVDVVVALPRSAIDSTVTDLNLRLILAALGSIAIVAAVAFLPGRAIVGALRELSEAVSGLAQGHLSARVPVRGRDEFARLGRAFNDMAAQLEARQSELVAERARVARAIDRVGTALAAGNEPDALLGVIAESIQETCGAVAVTVVRGGAEVARAGDPAKGGDPVSLELGPVDGPERGMLVLYPPAGRAFDEGALAEARSLATQGSIALENARLHRVLAAQAVTDELTGLANRRRFQEALEHEVSRVRRFGGPVSLIVADIDDFKAVNDRFGHPLGDRVLRAFADVLRATVRTVDITARPGGEEFAVLLPGTALGEAASVAERLRRGFAACRVETPVSAPLTVTASFGVAELAADWEPADLFAAADEALYDAKARGKNRVVASRQLARSGDPA